MYYGFNYLSERLIIMMLPFRFKGYIEFWHHLLVTATFLLLGKFLMDKQDNNVYNYGIPSLKVAVSSIKFYLAQPYIRV